MKKTIVCVVALLLSLTACGGKDEPKKTAPNDADKVAVGLSELLQEQSLSKEDADCVSKKLVAELGVGHLKDLKVVDDKLKVSKTMTLSTFNSDADAPKVAAIYVDCMTVAGLLRQQYQTIDQKTAECMAEAFGRERMVMLTTASLQGSKAVDETPEDVKAKMADCVPKN